MTWGNQNTDEEAAEQLCAAWDAGVNFLDTAEGYPVPMTAERQGATDRAIGRRGSGASLILLYLSTHTANACACARACAGYAPELVFCPGASRRTHRHACA